MCKFELQLCKTSLACWPQPTGEFFLGHKATQSQTLKVVEVKGQLACNHPERQRLFNAENISKSLYLLLSQLTSSKGEDTSLFNHITQTWIVLHQKTILFNIPHSLSKSKITVVWHQLCTRDQNLTNWQYILFHMTST